MAADAYPQASFFNAGQLQGYHVDLGRAEMEYMVPQLEAAIVEG